MISYISKNKPKCIYHVVQIVCGGGGGVIPKENKMCFG